MPFNEPIAPRTFGSGCANSNIEVFTNCDKIIICKFATSINKNFLCAIKYRYSMFKGLFQDNLLLFRPNYT